MLLLYYPHDVFFHSILLHIALANSMGWKFNCSHAASQAKLAACCFVGVASYACG